MIAIVDYGMGNLGSILNMLRRIGADAVITAGTSDIETADRIILPGVGAFDNGMKNLADRGLLPVLNARVIGEGTPVLGICLGMQLLADVGYEDGEWAGLGLMPGTCERLPAGVKVPHIGWNTVEYPRESPLFEGIPESTAFYFVHSYRLSPRDSSVIVGSTEYGVRFAAAVQRRNSYAVQFHPEKSSTMGLHLLANFGRIAEGAHA